MFPLDYLSNKAKAVSAVMFRYLDMPEAVICVAGVLLLIAMALIRLSADLKDRR